MKITKYCLYYVFWALFFSAYCVNSNASEITVGVGQSLYLDRGNGIWYQNGFQHDLDLKSNVWSITVSDNITDGLDWDVGFISLGTVHSNAIATPSDANYNGATGSCVGKCWPLSNFVGEGKSSGFTLDLSPFTYVHGFKIAGYLGLYVNRSTWGETVYNWEATEDGERHTITANAKPEWKAQFHGGFSVKCGNVSVRYSYFKNPIGQLPDYISIWRATQSVTVNWTFK